MSGIWEPLRVLIQKYADTPRPLMVGTVTNTDKWSATGPSWIRATILGADRLMIYRDGPRPAIGSPIQCVQMSPGVVSDWLALPLPQGCAGTVYVSLIGVGGSAGTYTVARLDLQSLQWTYLSAHPAGGGPITSAGGVYLLAWEDGGDLYQSADGGVTWGGAVLGGVNDVTPASHDGVLHAVTDSALYESGDYGATWGSVAGLPSPGLRVAQDMTGGIGLGYDVQSIVTSAGLYVNFPATVGMCGPFTPAPTSPRGGVARSGAVTLYWPGSGDLYALPDGYTSTFTTGAALTDSIDYDPGTPPYFFPYTPNSYPGGGAGTLADWGGLVEVAGGEAWFAVAAHDSGTRYYDGASGDVRAVALVSANPPERQPVSFYGADRDCRLVALDTATAPALLLADFGDTGTGAFAVVGTTVAGETYVVSERGLATLEVWRAVES